MTTSDDDAVPHEVEGALLIRADEGQVVRGIEAMTEAAGFRLMPRRAREIVDTYFDTPDRRLGNRRIAFRLRVEDGHPLLTLKVGGGDDPEVADRLELELPWSDVALNRVLAELQEHGVSPPARAADAPPPMSSDPVRALREVGFEVIQTRRTRRSPRDVVAREGGPALAELAVDDVGYEIADRTVHLKEIEVEAKGEGDQRVVAEVLASLREAFPGRVQAWRHSKLMTGKAIASLLGSGPAEGLIDEDGKISPAGYDALQELLGEDR